MYYGRFDARSTAKTVLAGAIVLGIMLATGMYATYPDLVTPCYAGTVALWAGLSFIVRKMMK
jgi:hypothetical protein